MRNLRSCNCEDPWPKVCFEMILQRMWRSLVIGRRSRNPTIIFILERTCWVVLMSQDNFRPFEETINGYSLSVSSGVGDFLAWPLFISPLASSSLKSIHQNTQPFICSTLPSPSHAPPPAPWNHFTIIAHIQPKQQRVPEHLPSRSCFSQRQRQ